MNIEGRLVYAGKTLMCTRRQDGEFAVLRFCGMLTRQDLALATRMVSEMAEMRGRLLILDLSEVPVVDEVGRGMLRAIAGIATGIGLLPAAVVSPSSAGHGEVVACLRGSVPIYGSVGEFRDELHTLAHNGSIARH